MIGIDRIIVILRMTTKTIPWQAIPLGMTTGTIQAGMSSLQKPIRTMIKGNIMPADKSRSMTGFTVCRETESLVIGIRGAVVVTQVAGYTSGRQSGVLTATVTVGTFGHLVLPG
jgi:hypothetical protein